MSNPIRTKRINLKALELQETQLELISGGDDGPGGSYSNGDDEGNGENNGQGGNDNDWNSLFAIPI